MGRQDHVDLLALCRLKGISWYLIAREALRARHLAPLLEGKVAERSTEATEARRILAASRGAMSGARDTAAAIIEAAEARGARLTTVLDEDYPLNLRTIYNLPPFLFYRGRLDADRDARSVAVVGTRQPSPEGVAQAREMARLLAEERVEVLSGLARGIDTAAHEAALEAGGRTVAVMGTGIHVIYPAENAGLAERIVEAGGALVSQFLPNAPPTSYSFPRRNVTMSGMGQGTVVIEASSTSGAKMQARLALDHGKKVFLLHALVTKQPWARNYLATRGAIEVQHVGDIIAKLRAPAEIRARAHKAGQLELLASP
jgi:DNA processing protein